jgi:hypothetical protein
LTQKSPATAQRGSTATYFAIMLPIIGMFSAFGIEVVYLGVVKQQLQGVSDAASHSASLAMDGTDAGLFLARQAAKNISHGMTVDFHDYELHDSQIEFLSYDTDTDTYSVVNDGASANSVRVLLTETEVGLGFGRAFFNKVYPVSACAAVMQGPGNATTGDVGGPGLENGHFDYDTTDARRSCPGSTTCDGTAKHTHEFDDDHNVTWANTFDGLGGHLTIDGCTEDAGAKKKKKGKKGGGGGGGGKIGTCGDSYSRTVPDGVPFKIVVVNADLSPGGWLTINGVETDVMDYDDVPLGNLPTYVLGGVSPNVLNSLEVNFDVNAIANCELIPTNTGDVRSNTPGIFGEWRSGALTVQLVADNAIGTPGFSTGDHDAVINEDDGLLWEGTFFWHWDGPSYTAKDADNWREQYNDLDCHTVTFIDNRPGNTACN